MTFFLGHPVDSKVWSAKEKEKASRASRASSEYFDNFHEISLTALVQSVQTAATLWIQMVLSPALKENNQNAMVA